MLKKDVDIIIIAYNRKQLITQILKQLEIQTIKNFNLIISDDGSRTEELINPNDYPIITKYLWNKDEGYCRVGRLNDGLKACVSDNIIIIDDDCVPKYETFIETHLKNLETYKISKGLIRFTNGTESGGAWFSTANIAFKKEVIDTVGLFDPGYDGFYGFEDVDFGLELKKHGYCKASPSYENSVTLHLGRFYADGDRSDKIMSHNRAHFISKWGYDASKEIREW